MDTIFNGLSGWRKVGLPGAYTSAVKVLGDPPWGAAVQRTHQARRPILAAEACGAWPHEELTWPASRRC